MLGFFSFKGEIKTAITLKNNNKFSYTTLLDAGTLPKEMPKKKREHDVFQKRDESKQTMTTTLRVLCYFVVVFKQQKFGILHE